MLAVIKGKLEAHRPHHLPQSLTGKAIAYALERWGGKRPAKHIGAGAGLVA